MDEVCVKNDESSCSSDSDSDSDESEDEGAWVATAGLKRRETVVTKKAGGAGGGRMAKGSGGLKRPQASGTTAGRRKRAR